LEQSAETPTVARLEDEESEAQLKDDMAEKADTFIEDAINRLAWDQMQELLAGLMRAMGYRTTVSEGPDRGVDVFASPDGLGQQEPRIFIEVKHRPKTQMGSKEIRAFLGGRKKGDKCLYVSTGGFTKDAQYEADRAEVPLRLLTLPDLRRLLVEQYEKLDDEARALVPLRRLYWPISLTRGHLRSDGRVTQGRHRRGRAPRGPDRPGAQSRSIDWSQRSLSLAGARAGAPFDERQVLRAFGAPRWRWRRGQNRRRFQATASLWRVRRGERIGPAPGEHFVGEAEDVVALAGGHAGLERPAK
jgi:hypothetical protein